MTGADRARMQHTVYIIVAFNEKPISTTEVAAKLIGTSHSELIRRHDSERNLLVRRVRNALNILENKGLVEGRFKGPKEKVWSKASRSDDKDKGKVRE